jgi:hypothetical protein
VKASILALPAGLVAASLAVGAHAQRSIEVDELEPAVNTSETIATAPIPAVAPDPETQERPVTDSASSERAAASATPAVIDRLDLGTTSITGNQELPKVLYIVPWKQSDLGELIGRPVNTLLDEVLAPVDRRVFDRHLSYYEALHGESQEE